MANRQSFVYQYRASLSSPLCPTTRPPHDLPPPFEKEIPSSSPIFDGHLYLRSDKKQWQWCLFRFDGVTLTCLSNQKVPLPPHLRKRTLPYDPTLPSFPLMPSQDNHRLFLCPTSPDHYLVPRWTVDMMNVSAVSLLQKKKRSPSRCFCVRTVHGQCYILKASNQKDLDHWLFALTKMWQFSQAARKHEIHMQSPSSAQPSVIPTIHPRHHSLPVPPPLPQHQPSIGTHVLPPSSHRQTHQRHLVPPQQPLYYSQFAKSSPHLSTPAPTFHHANASSPMVAQGNDTPLSEEKRHLIDAWRRSLSELMLTDPDMANPSIASKPDDSDDDLPSDDLLTSVSQTQPLPPPVLTGNMTSTQVKHMIDKKYPPVSPAPRQHTSYHVPYFQGHASSASSPSSASSDQSDVKDRTMKKQLADDHPQRASADQPEKHLTHLPVPPPSSGKLDHPMRFLPTTSAKTVQIAPPPLTQRPSSLYMQSPLCALEQVAKDDDEISLADLQRSLKRASLQPSDVRLQDGPRHHRSLPRPASWIPSGKQPVVSSLQSPSLGLN